MFKHWRISPRGGRLTLAVAVVLAASAGWAFAATTRSSGVIHACAAKGGGALRLARVCHKNERAVSRNVQGIPGKNGTNGTNGTNGMNGSNGTNGTSGAPGTARAYGRVAADGTLSRSKKRDGVTCRNGRVLHHARGWNRSDDYGRRRHARLRR
jgi:hypothetical protein